MATFSKVLLSGSTGGRPIKVAATATAGTLVHATGTSATVLDEVWLYAHNSSGAAVNLTVEFGGVSSPDDLILLSVPSRTGLTLVLPGLVLAGDGSAVRNVRAFAGTTNVVTVVGYVNRITP